MGVTRKTLSVFTVGLVDYRSAKDKTVRNTRKIEKHTKKLLEQETARAQAEALLAKQQAELDAARAVRDELRGQQ